MKTPKTYEEAVKLAMWAHGKDVSFSGLRQATRLVSAFPRHGLNADQCYQLSALRNALVGLQASHRENPINTMSREQIRARLHAIPGLIIRR